MKDFPLVILDLRGTDITDEGIEKLRSIKTLRTLVLEDCQKIGHRGFKALSTLDNLEVLSLRNTRVSDVDVEALLPLKEMKLLYISKSEAITDRAVDTVLKFEQLISLRIGSTSLTKAGIEKLQKHPNLSFLGLRDRSMRFKRLMLRQRILRKRSRRVRKSVNSVNSVRRLFAVTRPVLPGCLKTLKPGQLSSVSTALACTTVPGSPLEKP